MRPANLPINGNYSPTISGVNDTSITVGDKFDPLSGVTASDKEDGDLTSKIVVSGSVDTTKTGDYTLKYTVIDSNGLSTTKERVVTVLRALEPGQQFYDPSKTYKYGDQVVYKDGLYECISWYIPPTDDSSPNNTKYWKLIKVLTDESSTTDNTAPVIKGVSDKQINIGDTFDPLTGITASDKEDGDLTSNITVTGTVDTSKAGVYELTYSVTDSKGLTTTAKSTITVIDNTASEIPTYDSTTAYAAGDVVIYNGVKYQAKWWTQGETPGSSEWGAWEKIS